MCMPCYDILDTVEMISCCEHQPPIGLKTACPVVGAQASVIVASVNCSIHTQTPKRYLQAATPPRRWAPAAKYHTYIPVRPPQVPLVAYPQSSWPLIPFVPLHSSTSSPLVRVATACWFPLLCPTSWYRRRDSMADQISSATDWARFSLRWVITLSKLIVSL